MKTKLIKTLIISIICIHLSSFAVNDEQKLVVATLGSSITAGITGYSQDEINNESLKKITNSIPFINYLYYGPSIADALINRTTNYADKLKILNIFSLINEKHKTYFFSVRIPNIIAMDLLALANDPLTQILNQLNTIGFMETDIILGIDLFFWIIYSKDSGKEQTSNISNHKKIQNLKQLLGLLNLHAFATRNVIIGNIPQVSCKILWNNYSPDPALIAHANSILQDWVTDRNSSNDKAKAILLDISEVYKIAKTDSRPIVLHKDMPAYTRNEILSTDDLHLSTKGVNILITYIAKSLIDSDVEIFHKLGTMLDN